MIAFNQVLCALLSVSFLVWDIIWACVCGNTLDAVSSISLALGFIGLFATIVCVESRLDAYRLDREAAGWTEEAGYPEGYVHEYEKKK